MRLEIKLNSPARRAACLLTGLALGVVLTLAAVINVVVGMLTDQRVSARKDLLAAAIVYAPNSATLNARLAEAEMEGEDRDTLSAADRAARSVNLSPWDYRPRLLLATIREAQGDRAAAEESLREALALAPNYTDVHWRLAHLLLREGKLARSVVEFRAANSSNSALLPGTLDLLWRVSAGNLAVVQAVTPPDPKSRLSLAAFLLKQSRPSDAITLFSGIDRNSLTALPESSAFISSLISQGRVEEARGLWVGVVSGAYAQPDRPLPVVWNGGFESDVSSQLSQFDWSIGRNEFAIASVDSAMAHSGSRSLRIDFTGRDTTRLDGQVKQMLVLHPGSRYRLQCFVKTELLETPEGPRVILTDASLTPIVGSDPIPAGSSDWREIAIDFTAPANARAVVITIKRVPKFAYDNPTRGTVWFDDFALIEQTK